MDRRSVLDLCQLIVKAGRMNVNAPTLPPATTPAPSTPPGSSTPRNRLTTYHAQREIEADRRRLECFTLRIEGHSVREIGRRVGLSPARVQDYLKQARTRLRAQVDHAAEGIRQKERADLEAIIAKWQPIAAASASHPRAALRATEIVLRAHTALRATCGQPELSEPASVIPPTPPAPPTAPEPPDDPEPDPDPFTARLFADPVYQGAYHGLLPRSSYDDAWDALENWQPGKYKPDTDMEAYLRPSTRWAGLMARG